MTAVIDASVIIKWLLQDPEREADTTQATQLMESVASGALPVLQPVHWLAEVGAVLARESPATAVDDVTMLAALEFPVTQDPLVLRRGVELAIDFGQHLFDTLYHAVALESADAVLITADGRYLRAALQKGRIQHLMDWRRSPR
ncbi:MAG TPA: type II toxin-antitoxin system VapC family toxin [Steroidobacteraceae bacterium]|jgi:predicted nucleic acid-binding protein|nr:type II toxin-antitoxin system VapC family toxin [Steroidobacteraceae bacterium]